MADLKALAEAVIKGDPNTAVTITKQAIAEKMPAGTPTIRLSSRAAAPSLTDTRMPLPRISFTERS